MLICNHCGETFVGTLPTYTEVHGHTSLGNTIGEKVVDNECPHCHCGELVKASECKVCGEWFDDEHHYHICESCLDDNKTLEMALAIGEENETDVYINGFAKSLLGDKKINEILVEYIKANYTTETAKKAIGDYCDEDKSYFAEWVEYDLDHKE